MSRPPSECSHGVYDVHLGAEHEVVCHYCGAPCTIGTGPSDTPRPATEGGLEDDVRALLDAWDDTTTATRWSTIELAVERLRARLGAGGDR